MTCYKKLSISSNPLKDGAFEKLLNIKSEHPDQPYQIIRFDVQEFLSDDILDLLRKQYVIPKYLISFGYKKEMYDVPGQDRGFLHSDIFYDSGKWVDIPCAINWEISPTKSKLTWYETNVDTPIFWPDTAPFEARTNQPGSVPQAGKHYGKRQNKDSSDFTPIDSLDFETSVPYLLRTDLPHDVKVQSRNIDRLSISVRFAYQDITTWEQAMEIFKPLFLD